MSQLLQFLQNYFDTPLWIYRVATPRRTSGPGMPTPEEEEEEEKKKEEAAKKLKEEEALAAMRPQVEAAPVTDDTKQLMRECLASDSLERHNLVEQLLRKEVNEADFKRRIEGMETEDHSWQTIFREQRNIRKKIQELQWRTESYTEFIPRGKIKFDSLLKQIRTVNRQDDGTDRTLKRDLHKLTEPNAQMPQAVLHPEEARRIYEADPLKEGVDKTLKMYRSKIEAAPNGKNLYKKFIALKREELRIERQFSVLYDKLEKIISDNLKKVRSKAERERLLKAASKSVGVRLKEGTVIEFDDPDILALPAGTNTVSIARITFDPVKIYDHEGKVIDQANGVPHIHLSNDANLTLGRFKKWLDMGGGVEKVTSLDDVNRITGLEEYGIKIQKGMELSYLRHKKDQQGNVTKVPAYVRITDVDNERIYFNEPVLFQPGYESEDYDFRESLNFGEFIKWWHRYEVEKSVSLQELRDLLIQYNTNENKFFGYESADNPIILVDRGEELKYPDEEGLVYRIQNVDTDGVTLDNGEKFTCPEFFYWVKNNHVQKIQRKEKLPEELTAEEKREKELKEEIAADEREHELMRIAGSERNVAIARDIKKREAGSLLGTLKEMWWTTQFLSLKDLWNMTKEVVEFVKRKHERRSKGRYGEVGSRLPWIIGPEFERVKQSAENEEVNKYKEAMEHWSVEKVKRTLNETSSKDLVKACIMTLLHHGEMRWDDHHLWETMNRLTSRYTLRGAELYIPKPHLIPPGKNGEDMVGPAVNALWGAGQFESWFQENISKYNSNKNNYEYKFKNLEADPKGTGGPDGECERLIKAWMDGEYVNPQDYEEMIDGAIKYGKMGAEGKMFYIIVGCMARQGMNKGRTDGETLLPLDRPGELNSKYLNQFPMLDFFTQEKVTDYTIWDPEKNNGPGKPKGGWGKSRKFNLTDYQRFVNEYFPDELKKGKPGPQFSRFMWEVMIMGEKVRTRISKGIRNAENMDHDDAHLFIPPTTPTEIDSLTTGPSGQKKYFTNEGYANAYPGFNQYIISLSYCIEEETDEETKDMKKIALRDVINAFVRYDAILDNRLLKKEGDHRARLDDRHYRRATVVDSSCPLRKHQEQLRNLILEIGRAYGQDWDSWLYGAKTGSSLDPKEKEKQDEYERKLDGLKDLIPRLFEQDGGDKMMEVIKRGREKGLADKEDMYGLRGIVSSRRPPPEEVAKLKEYARQATLKRGHEGGH